MGLNPLVQRVFKGLFDRNKNQFRFAFLCPSLFTALSSRARGWLRFCFRTLGSLDQSGGVTTGATHAQDADRASGDDSVKMAGHARGVKMVGGAGATNRAV